MALLPRNVVVYICPKRSQQQSQQQPVSQYGECSIPFTCCTGSRSASTSFAVPCHAGSRSVSAFFPPTAAGCCCTALADCCLLCLTALSRNSAASLLYLLLGAALLYRVVERQHSTSIPFAQPTRLLLAAAGSAGQTGAVEPFIMPVLMSCSLQGAVWAGEYSGADESTVHFRDAQFGHSRLLHSRSVGVAVSGRIVPHWCTLQPLWLLVCPFLTPDDGSYHRQPSSGVRKGQTNPSGCWSAPS